MKNIYVKYKGIIMIVAAIVFVFAVMLFSSLLTNKNVPTSGTGQVVSPGSISYEGTKTLKKNAYDQVNALIEQYFNAKMNVDMTAMAGLVSDITQVNVNKIQAQLQYVEKIQNVQSYTIDGPKDGSYRVYVYYELKIRGVDTPAPALTGLYVTKDETGKYVIYLGALDKDEQEFIEKSDKNKDVKELSSLVKKSLDEALNNDANLKEFYNVLEESLKAAGQSSASPAAISGNSVQ